VLHADGGVVVLGIATEQEQRRAGVDAKVVSNALPSVLTVTTPRTAPSTSTHTLFPSPPAWLGSKSSRVAATFLPNALVIAPLTRMRFEKLLFAGGPMTTACVSAVDAPPVCLSLPL
jgi:hypothetical protein